MAALTPTHNRSYLLLDQTPCVRTVRHHDCVTTRYNPPPSTNTTRRMDPLRTPPPLPTLASGPLLMMEEVLLGPIRRRTTSLTLRATIVCQTTNLMAGRVPTATIPVDRKDCIPAPMVTILHLRVVTTTTIRDLRHTLQ